MKRYGSIRGRFQIVSAIMPRFEIYGRTKPFETHRHLFIVTENHLLQPVRSLSSLSFFPRRILSSWPPSSPARVSAFNARCRRRPPAVLKRYEGMRLRTNIRCNFVHRQKRSFGEAARKRIYMLIIMPYVSCGQNYRN